MSKKLSFCGCHFIYFGKDQATYPTLTQSPEASPPMKTSSKFLLACSVAGLSLAQGTAFAQIVLISPTVNDGGFEATTGPKAFFVSPASPTANPNFNSVPYWGATLVNTAGNTVGAPNDSGVDPGTTPSTGNDVSPTHTGQAGGFWQPTGSSTAFNLVTSRAMAAGDVYNLTWFARKTGNGGQQVLRIFSQLTSTVTDPASYTYQPDATLLTADGAANATYNLGGTPGVAPGTPFAQYSVTYTATVDDAGKYIGVNYGSSGTAYIAADDFTLTVTPVPEPSTYALLGAGLGGLLLMGRRRRASVQ